MTFHDALQDLILASEQPEVIVVAADVAPHIRSTVSPSRWRTDAAGQDLIDLDVGTFPVVVRSSLPSGYVMACPRSVAADLDTAIDDLMADA